MDFGIASKILVYSTAGLLYFIDSFSFKRVRMERVTAVVSRVSMATQPSLAGASKNSAYGKSRRP